MRKARFTWMPERLSAGLPAVALALAGLLFAWAGPAVASTQPTADATADAIQQSDSEMVPVLIGFDHAVTPADVTALETMAGAKLKYVYSLIPAVAASIPVDRLAGLAEVPGVLIVEPDTLKFICDAELDASWGVKRIGAGYSHLMGENGAAIKVAIVDTGIDYRHPEFAGRYGGGYDFANNDDDPMDDHGHGTHCAGIVGAANDDVGVVGVAPLVMLYAVKVLDASGSGWDSDIIAGVEWATLNGMQVTNHSYGAGSDPGDLFQAAYDAAWEAGVVQIAAAGNSGLPFFNFFNTVGWPARYESVVAVAATDKSNARAWFSSTGAQVEIAAPGVGIKSCFKGGGYTKMDGTSMASPHVVGAAAAIIAAGIQDTNHNGRINDEVRQRLIETAIDLKTEGWDKYTGHGLVNAQAALTPPIDLRVSEIRAGQVAGFAVDDATPGATVVFVYSLSGRGPTLNDALGIVFAVVNPVLIGSAVADASGHAELTMQVPPDAPRTTVWIQAAEQWNPSNLVTRTIN